jgi:hypothetical protein
MIFPNGAKYAFKEVSNRDLSLPFALNKQLAEGRKENVRAQGFEPWTE